MNLSDVTEEEAVRILEAIKAEKTDRQKLDDRLRDLERTDPDRAAILIRRLARSQNLIKDLDHRSIEQALFRRADRSKADEKAVTRFVMSLTDPAGGREEIHDEAIEAAFADLAAKDPQAARELAMDMLAQYKPDPGFDEIRDELQKPARNRQRFIEDLQDFFTNDDALE